MVTYVKVSQLPRAAELTGREIKLGVQAGQSVSMPELDLAAPDGASLVGFTGPDSTPRTLADLASPIGAEMIGITRIGIERAEQNLAKKALERISVNDFFVIGDADWTNAFERARAYLTERGGGVLELPDPRYVARFIVIPRSSLYQGTCTSGTELVQADSVGTDFITSENFQQLTGTGRDVVGDPRVPSWLGLKSVRINGNRAANVAGRAVALYAANIILDDVQIYQAAGDGLHTEYAANISGLGGWSAQEEGYVRNLICRENGGVGWRNRGPHNAYLDNIICCLNDDYGFVNEIRANLYNGAPTYISVLHCYSNDMKWTPASGRARKSMSIGTNVSCGLLVIDGSQCLIPANNCLFGIVKQYYGGQGGDACVIQGNYNQVGVYYGIMRNDGESSGSTSLVVDGNFNTIGNAQIFGTANLFDGLRITGVGNAVPYLFARDCRTSVTITGSRNQVGGLVEFCNIGLQYARPTDVHGGWNRVNLDIYSNFGAYVAGDAPVPGRDAFNVRGAGLAGGFKYTESTLEVTSLDTSNTNVQTVTVPHNLLYAPRRQDVSLTMTGMTNTTGTVAFLRCTAADATNITIQYKMATATAAGGQMSVGVRTKIS
ncbi:hypothetical protein [Burkholderia cenocepacia]|uniref:hypothetical protein n=1 Tax=Burkholderia cenocepacia TaxID=95486 RepID=UPI001B8E7443|nr:hypothetical protein [Burkholderia cenocepacia]MBR8137176.1 hypothetical protein [Burkholderia cenocepacia]